MAGHHLLASIQVNFCFWSSGKIWYMQLLPYNCPHGLWRVGQKLLSKNEFMRYSIRFSKALFTAAYWKNGRGENKQEKEL